MAILPVGAPGPRDKTRAKLVEAEPEGISGPGFESPHLHQESSKRRKISALYSLFSHTVFSPNEASLRWMRVPGSSV